MKKVNQILLIDDNEIDNFINSRVIQDAHITERTEIFSNPKQALDYLKQVTENQSETIENWIFLDLNMPNMDGWDFLTEFEETGMSNVKNLTVFILSCTINKKDIHRVKNHPRILDFIPKPLTLDKLKLISQQIYHN